MRVLYPQGDGDMVADYSCYKGGEEHLIQHMSQYQYLYPEQRSGNRRTEDSGKTGADTADNQFSPILIRNLQQIGKRRCQPRADLGAWPLFTCRTTTGKCYDGCSQLYRNYSKGDFAHPFVHRFNDLFGAVTGCIGRQPVHQCRTGKQRERQEVVIVGISGCLARGSSKQTQK